MTDYDFTCYACTRPATRWVVKKGRWYDCCFIHAEKLENGQQTLIQEKKTSRWKILWNVLGFLFFVIVLALTIVGFLTE